MNARKLLSAAKAVEAAYIEDVFSTYLYTGNGSTQTITNGIDLSGKGGMLWLKGRASAYSNLVTSTNWGTTPTDGLITNSTAGQGGLSNTITFNSNGWTHNNGALGDYNVSGQTYVSWAFRKQAKFFDVVTYTGDGTSNRAISHNLGSVPGCIIVKATSTASTSNRWGVYHRAMDAAPEDYTMYLDLTNAKSLDAADSWGPSGPSSTTFIANRFNDNTVTYVAYLFAHDAGGFGASGSDNVISCGSFTTDSSGNATVTLGYEPQWVLFKRTNSADNWITVDTMRGFAVTSPNNSLFPNLSNAENTGAFRLLPSATGFLTSNADGNIGGNNTYIYIAIRRGPMKTPTTGTSVFVPATRAGTGATATTSNLTFPPDVVWSKGRDNGGTNSGGFDRLRGATKQLSLNQSDAEITASTSLTGFDVMTGYTAGADAVQLTINATGYNYVNWNFRRAPGFFDVVCFTSNGSGGSGTQQHSLSVTPQLAIFKARGSTSSWPVFSPLLTSSSYRLVLNTTAAQADTGVSASLSATTFDLGNGLLNLSSTYVAYLFATCPGVSKVGSYTGTGNVLQIDCGFTGGARFVLIKRTDNTGDWYVWDSARGIVAGNDPYLLLNSTAAEVTTTDWVDTHSPGFELSSAVGNNANISTASYIFLAIA